MENKFGNSSYNKTDMEVGYFANQDKLISSARRNENVKSAGGDIDEGIDNYKINQNHVFEEKHEEKHEEKPENKQTDLHTDANNSAGNIQNNTFSNNQDDEKNWTPEELHFRKLGILKKLGELSLSGVKLSQNYNSDSDYKTMQFEYDLHTGIRAKQNAVELMSGAMCVIIKGVEMLNDNYNPFDIKFEGSWSSKIATDLNNYHTVIGEIYDKYTTSGRPMAPELRLFMMLISSAVFIQMHKGITKMMPNMASKLNANPDILENIQQKNNASNNSLKIMEQQKQETEFLKQKNNEYQHVVSQLNNQNSSLAQLNKNLILSEKQASEKKSDMISEHKKLLNIQTQLTSQPLDLRSIKTESDTKSVVSKNPKIKEILANQKKILEKSEDSEKSEKSKKSSITIKLASSDSSDSETSSDHKEKKKPVKKSKEKTKEKTKEFLLEQISFGKKSNTSKNQPKPVKVEMSNKKKK